jgi:hypothetical protein
MIYPPSWQPFLAHTDAAGNHGGPIVVISIVGVSVIGVNADENCFFSKACDN